MKALIFLLAIILHSFIDATGDAFAYKAERPDKFKWKHHRLMEHVFQALLVLFTIIIAVLGTKNFAVFGFTNMDIHFIKALILIVFVWSLIRFAVFDPCYNLQIGQKWGYVGKTALIDRIRHWLIIKLNKSKAGKILITAIQLILGGNFLSKIIFLVISFLILNQIIV